MRSTRLWLLVFVFGFLGGLFGELYHSKVLAARNAGGNYTLPSPQNPVVTGTTIKSTDFNTTMNDIGSELTNSLDRSGRGCMTGAIQSANGTKAAPGVTWCSETGSGLYRNASQDIRMSVNATDVQQWTPAGTTVYGTEAVGNASSGAVSLAVTGDTSGSFNGLTVTGNASSGAILATGGTQATLNTVGWRAFQGVGGTGNGTGGGGLGLRGVGGTGGATSGTGGAGAVLSGGAGGAPNGIGGIGGSAQGNVGVGTGAGGDGFTSLGGGAPGAGAGGNGVTATGGTSASGTAGFGVNGTGAGTTAGGTFANGTAATGSTYQDAIIASNGDISFAGVNPNSNVGFSNRQTGKNVVKAWMRGSSNGTSGYTVNDGFNVAATTSTCAASLLTVTLTTGVANATNSLCVAQQQIGSATLPNHLVLCSFLTTTTVGVYSVALNSTPSIGIENICTTVIQFGLEILGAQ